MLPARNALEKACNALEIDTEKETILYDSTPDLIASARVYFTFLHAYESPLFRYPDKVKILRGGLRAAAAEQMALESGAHRNPIFNQPFSFKSSTAESRTSDKYAHLVDFSNALDVNEKKSATAQ